MEGRGACTHKDQRSKGAELTFRACARDEHHDVSTAGELSDEIGQLDRTVVVLQNGGLR